MSQKNLINLFNEVNNGNVYKWHHYLDTYQEIFGKFCGKELVILEIGILNGGSLRLWRDYFGNRCKVYGIDINQLAKQYESDGIEIRIGDQSDHNFLEELVREVGSFDIVIDDGAHTNYMVRSSFNILYPNTKYLYIVEDTMALYWYFGLYSLARDCIYAITGQNKLQNKIKRLIKILMLWVFGKLSFVNFAKKKADELTTQWHKRPYGEMHPGEMKEINCEAISDFAKSTQSVQFFDSLIIFQKKESLKKIVEFK